MLAMLMRLAGGRVVCALEGGYNVTATAECAAACVQVHSSTPDTSMQTHLLCVSLTMTQMSNGSFTMYVTMSSCVWHSAAWPMRLCSPCDAGIPLMLMTCDANAYVQCRLSWEMSRHCRQTMRSRSPAVPSSLSCPS